MFQYSRQDLTACESNLMTDRGLFRHRTNHMWSNYTHIYIERVNEVNTAFYIHQEGQELDMLVSRRMLFQDISIYSLCKLL